MKLILPSPLMPDRSKRFSSSPPPPFKGSVILKGYRGKKPVDLEALADILVHVSSLMMTRDDVMELDANPVMAFEHGAVAVDARALLKEK